MFDELSDILRNRVSPEVMSGIAELVVALDKHNAFLYKDRINQLVMSANNHESLTLHDEAISIVFSQVNALLQQMRLVIDVENLRLSRLAQVLEALLFNPSDDDDEIARIIDQGEDPVDVLCDILAIKMNDIPESFMDIILDVPIECIAAIEEKIHQNLRPTEEAVDGLQEITRLLNQHSEMAGVPTIGLESLKEGNSSEIDPAIIIEQRRSVLVTLNPVELADQLISIVLLSGVELDELQEEVMVYVESVIHDPFDIQKAYKRVVSRVSDLRNVK